MYKSCPKFIPRNKCINFIKGQRVLCYRWFLFLVLSETSRLQFNNKMFRLVANKPCYWLKWIMWFFSANSKVCLLQVQLQVETPYLQFSRVIAIIFFLLIIILIIIIIIIFSLIAILESNDMKIKDGAFVNH